MFCVYSFLSNCIPVCCSHYPRSTYPFSIYAYIICIDIAIWCERSVCKRRGHRGQKKIRRMNLRRIVVGSFVTRTCNNLWYRYESHTFRLMRSSVVCVCDFFLYSPDSLPNSQSHGKSVYITSYLQMSINFVFSISLLAPVPRHSFFVWVSMWAILRVFVFVSFGMRLCVCGFF